MSVDDEVRENDGKALNVLFLHPASAFGGASKSLIELYLLFHSEKVSGTVITPQGSAARAFSAAGMNVHSILGIS